MVTQIERKARQSRQGNSGIVHILFTSGSINARRLLRIFSNQTLVGEKDAQTSPGRVIFKNAIADACV